MNTRKRKTSERTHTLVSGRHEEEPDTSKKAKTEKTGGCSHLPFNQSASSSGLAQKTRASKPDFKDLYTKHRQIIDDATNSKEDYMNHEALVKLRK